MNPFAILPGKSFAPLLALLIALLFALPVQAHKLHLFASAEGGKISGFAYFPGGGKYQNGTISVYSGQERHLADLTTTMEGEFTWQASGPGDYLLVITTPDGHASRFTVPVQTTAAAAPFAGPDRATTSLPADHALSAGNGAGPPSALPPDLEQLLNSAISRQILPLREELTRYQQETRLRDILGGIGYIAGLFGIAAYLLARRERKKLPPHPPR